MDKHKILEANYSTLWKSTKANSKATLDSSASTSKGCSIFSNVDINALRINHAMLEEKIKSKDKEIARLNMLNTQCNIGAKPIPKVVDKQGLGHYKNNKANCRVVVKGHEIPCGTREATSTPLWILLMESPPLPQQRTSLR
jgi:hypothetical protein